VGAAEPTDIQAAAIPEVLAGGNVAIQSYTGSGKTLAYLLPALSLAVERAEAEWASASRRTKGQAGTVQLLVVAPSRELSMQIVRVAQALLPPEQRRMVQQCIGAPGRRAPPSLGRRLLLGLAGRRPPLLVELPGYRP
jgi:superfamily II DNA/RNA helicase